MRIRTVLAIASMIGALLCGGAGVASGPASVLKTPVSYSVTLSQDELLPGNTYSVRGFRYSIGRPSDRVALLLHGLSYGYWGWDFPYPSPDPANPFFYSVAKYLASRGIDAVAIDELGYGASDHPGFPDVRQLTIPAYANIAHQIVQQLRTSYEKVAIVGHSAGGEMSNFEAGRYRDVDALVDISMCDAGASQRVITDIAMNDLDVTSDYGYFGDNGGPERTALMFYTPDADPAVVALDNAMTNPTPTAEMQSISPQPAREMDPLVTAPVLVVFSQNDAIFPSDGSPLPVSCQQVQPLLYPLAESVTVYNLPAAGHTLMLHRNADKVEAALAAWLLAH